MKDSEFSGNFFDGVALYDSERIELVRCVTKLNDSAGISADNHLSKSRFVDCQISRNGDVGIFMRASRDIVFKRCEVEHSGDWGAFLAHNESGEGVHRVRFQNCRFFGNHGGIRMASVNERQSGGTVVRACSFDGNQVHGRADVDSAGSLVRRSKDRRRRVP